MAGAAPTYGQRKTALHGIPSVRVPANTQGVEAAAHFGATIANIGATFAGSLMADARDNADQARVLEASNQLQSGMLQFLHNPESGLLQTTQGRDTLTLPDQVDDTFNKMADEIGNSLSNDRQRLAFNRIRQSEYQKATISTFNHVDREMDQYMKGQQVAGLKLQLADATQNATDPVVIASALDKGLSIVDQMTKGQSPEAKAEKQLEFKSAMHSNVIDALLARGLEGPAKAYFDEVMNPSNPDWGKRPDGTTKGNGFFGPLSLPNGGVASEYSVGVQINGKEMDVPSLVPTLTKDEVQTVLKSAQDGSALPDSIVQKAADYAKQRVDQGKDPFAQAGEQNRTQYPEIAREAQHVPFTPEALKHIYASLEEGSLRGTAQQQTQQIMKTYETESAALEAVDKITDPKLQDAVRQRVEHAWGIKREAQREDSYGAMIRYGNMIDANPRVPPNQLIPPGEYTKLTIQQKEQLETYWKRNQTGGEGNIGKFYQLMRMSVSKDPKEIQAFKDLRLDKMFGEFTKSQFNELLSAQLHVLGKGDDKTEQKLNDFSIKSDIITSALNSHGIPTTGAKADHEAIGQLHTIVQKEVLAFQGATGKQATDKDVTEIVNRVLGEQATSPATWRSLWLAPATQKPLVSTKITDIPTAAADQIRKGLQQAGLPSSDADVIQFYIRAKLRAPR